MIHEKWEPVYSESESFTDRLAVPGGWLYRCYWIIERRKRKSTTKMGMCFIPNPNGNSHIMRKSDD